MVTEHIDMVGMARGGGQRHQRHNTVNGSQQPIQQTRIGGSAGVLFRQPPQLSDQERALKFGHARVGRQDKMLVPGLALLTTRPDQHLAGFGVVRFGSW